MSDQLNLPGQWENEYNYLVGKKGKDQLDKWRINVLQALSEARNETNIQTALAEAFKGIVGMLEKEKSELNKTIIGLQTAVDFAKTVTASLQRQVDDLEAELEACKEEALVVFAELERRKNNHA